MYHAMESQILRATEDMVIKPALPKTRWKLVTKQAAGHLLPPCNKLNEVRAGAFPLDQEMYVIGHQAKSVY